MKHKSVLLKESIDNLNIKVDGVYVDATLGFGGHSLEILKRIKKGFLFAFDQDSEAISYSTERLKDYDNFKIIKSNFSNMQECLLKENVGKVDGILFDIGVSSMQLDQGERGFSFSKNAPLDMRMSQSGQTAADIINNLPESELADLIYQYGEERKSRQIAAKIIATRKLKKIETTKELAEIIYSIIRRSPNSIDPATRTFQALRIAVNDELGELQKGLSGATTRLKSQGRLVVVDFHSLEDRIVKTFFKNNVGKNRHVSRYAVKPQEQDNAIFKECSKAIFPSEEEVRKNSRSRSAKLRYAVKQ